MAKTTKDRTKKTFLKITLFSIILLFSSSIFFLFTSENGIKDTEYYKISSTSRGDSFSIITKKEKIKMSKDIPLFKGDKLSKEFISPSDNLGIVALSFNTSNRSIDDRILFRIKEKSSNKWYFEGTYNSNQIQNGVPFPFGFPVISKSKNITYLFEIESLNGTSLEHLSIKKEPIFLTKHQYSRTEILKNPFSFFQFIVDKLIAQALFLTKKEVFFLFIIGIIPFFVYKLLLSVKKRKIISKINIKKSNIFIYLKKLSKYFKVFRVIKLAVFVDRKSKIRLTCLIVLVGFLSSLGFHYLQGGFFRLPYPMNTFLPAGFFGDFFVVFDEWSRFKFNGIGYGLSYFPGTYLLIDLMTRIFNIYYALIILLVLFSVFMFSYSYKSIKTDSAIESIQNSAILTFMSYPFLIAFQTANVEIITFICVVLFFKFYKRNNLLSLFFLSYAISMKIFPGIFILLMFFDKRFKDIFKTLSFALIFLSLPILFFDGGLKTGGFDIYLNNLKASQKMYSDLMIMSGAGNHYGHSLLNAVKSVYPSLFPSMSPVIIPYIIIISIVVIALIAYLFFEKTFWKRVTVLVMMMNLFPFTSTDYKLLYIFLPLFMLINYPKKEKFELLYVLLFSLLLIPKDYFYFNNWALATFNIVANALIMSTILFLVVLSSIKFNKFKK